MPGTDIAYAAPPQPTSPSRQGAYAYLPTDVSGTGTDTRRIALPRSPYARAARCPVLTKRIALPGKRKAETPTANRSKETATMCATRCPVLSECMVCFQPHVTVAACGQVCRVSPLDRA
eukprot:900659-Rhodomonas_salina.1